MKNTLLFTALAGLALAGSATAASPDYMMEDCKHSAQVFFQDYEARTEAKYEGQRTDKTHAVNGTIYLETRSEDFSCSYNAKGDTLVEFFEEGKGWPDFVKGKGSPHKGGGSTAGQTRDDSFDTVCGVMTGGKDYSYRCKVTDHYKDGSKTSTTLRFPDQTLKMAWKSGKHVEVQFEGMKARTVPYSNAEGEIDFVFEDKTYYYFPDKGRASSELKNLKD
jgi:hypothetical protein